MSSATKQEPLLRFVFDNSVHITHMILHHFINGTVLESNYFLGNFQNVMEYKKASIAGVICKGLENGMFSTGTEDHETLLDFMALLTVCHTVIPEKHEDGTHKVVSLLDQLHAL